MAQIFFVPGGRGVALLQNLGTLALLLILLPFNLTLVVFSWLLNLVKGSSPTAVTHPKKILLSGGKMTKSLQLARSFHAAGHEVFLVETHKYWLSGHRFSQAVKGFYTVPAPQKDPEGYCQRLLEIVKQENIVQSSRGSRSLLRRCPG